MKIRALIIHLNRANQRLENVKQLKASLPCPAQIINAIDGEKLTNKNITQYYQKKLIAPYYPFSLSKNEIACFLSHRAAWQYIVDNNLDAGFIVEDDVKLLEQFNQGFEFALAHVQHDSFIRFAYKSREHGRILFQDKEFKIMMPWQIGLGMQAQLVGRDAAKLLLEVTKKFDRPVDTLIQLYWHTNLRPYVIIPNIIQEVSQKLGGSSIQKKPNLLHKIKREIMRPLYRRKITALSKRHYKDRLSS